ncbi:Hypothetical predicted protein [Pelobates cultripes]|uniref:Uncharacterized protein n=1 Tax=Pelobates cultripes TaxID=61616 RepID=A0AAD1TKL5_PELCU|nr:Hypothetical predicted protein [Pelobates cultripes]
MTEISRLETFHKHNPTPLHLEQLTAALALLESLSLTATTKALACTKQKYYEKGKKAVSMLAKWLKSLTDTKQISNIRTPDGTTSDIPHKIGETFQQYFATLYNHTPNPPSEHIRTLTEDFP